MTIEGDGEQRRDFVYVEDVVRACQLAVSEPELAGRVYNIGGGRSTSILELVQTLQQLYPETPPPSYAAARPGDIRHSQANITEARRALGYRPTIDLKQGLGNTIQWFEAQLRRGEV
jgi:nucleoside-diphosphate-sugar epimerase